MVDWDKPIIAVNGTRYSRAHVSRPIGPNDTLIVVQLDGGNEYYFAKNGSGGESGWTICNDIQPDTVAVNRELWERTTQLMHDLHADHIKHGAHDYVQDFVARTAELIRLLPVEVDPDEAEAKRMAEEETCNRVGLALAGLKRGRELQKYGK